MSAPRIESITVQGFRAFGTQPQTLILNSNIAAVLGPNSQGKTSLAEAFEFLLTGKIVRRELTAGSHAEFANALRNAHLGADDPVYVEALITAFDGTEHTVRRTLTADYTKRDTCTSTLKIDGEAADQTGIAALGIVLSQPPLEAPVLAQHTLGYLFSAHPKERATYFKALLEVTDLEEFRNQTANLEDYLAPLDDPAIAKLEACSAAPEVSAALGMLGTSVPTEAELAGAFEVGARGLIEGAGRTVPEDPGARIAEIEIVLANRRGKTFPIQGFGKEEPANWRAPSEEVWGSLETYFAEWAKVDEETRRLTALFRAALKIPTVAELNAPEDCPLCGTEEALTPERVAFIRSRVADTEGFQQAETAAARTLRLLESTARNSAGLPETTLPQFLHWGRADRGEAGFTTHRIRTLLGDDAADLLPPWVKAIRALLRAATRLGEAAEHALGLTTAATADPSTLEELEPLKGAFQLLGETQGALVAAYKAYAVAEHALLESLNAVLDAESKTTGWQDFIDLARDPRSLHNALIERHARETVQRELQRAVGEIDKAKETVLDDKFTALSDGVQKWWDLLRPDEPTFFAGLGPRPDTRRTIDLKAGLSAKPDRSAPKIRDVIAVFSLSQLHCLGLALFLARAEREGAGFVVLDDPILSSNDDYSVHFKTSMLTQLLALPVQVILLTQDQTIWRDLENLYRHVGISMSQVFIENPAEGVVVRNTSDELLGIIASAEVLTRGGHPKLPKQAGEHLRDAGERFCKELLVQDRHTKGEATAALSDYEGKALEWLCPQVEPLLTQDPAPSRQTPRV